LVTFLQEIVREICVFYTSQAHLKLNSFLSSFYGANTENLVCLALFVQTGILSHSSSYGLKRVSVYTRTRKSRRQPFANKTCWCVGKCRTCNHTVHNWSQSSKYFYLQSSNYSFVSKVQNRYIDSLFNLQSVQNRSERVFYSTV
jgi:hypothetical protein